VATSGTAITLAAFSRLPGGAPPCGLPGVKVSRWSGIEFSAVNQLGGHELDERRAIPAIQ